MRGVLNYDIIPEITGSLIRSTDGIWSATRSEKLSYTLNGHELISAIEAKSFWFQHRNYCIQTLIKDYPCPFLVDVGGGNGIVSSALKNKGVNTILLEPEMKGILNAKNRGLEYLICSSLYEAQFFSDSIPAIGLFDVLEHIKDQDSFIKEISRVLQKKGKLFISVPAYSFLWSYHDISAGHYRRYTLRALTELLKANGFKILHKTYFFSLLILPMFILRNTVNIKSLTFNLVKQKKFEHQLSKLRLNKLYNIMLYPEIIFIKIGIKIPFGTSCLIACEKNN